MPLSHTRALPPSLTEPAPPPGKQVLSASAVGRQQDLNPGLTDTRSCAQ